LIFVAKEAFFKCQFPVALEWIDFDAVAVRVEDWDTDLGSFRIELRRHIALETHDSPGPGGWRGRFCRHDGFVMAGIALPASQ
jgi:4'-phosphopantetheinyl transferase EntD